MSLNCVYSQFSTCSTDCCPSHPIVFASVQKMAPKKAGGVPALLVIRYGGYLDLFSVQTIFRMPSWYCFPCLISAMSWAGSECAPVPQSLSQYTKWCLMCHWWRSDCDTHRLPALPTWGLLLCVCSWSDQTNQQNGYFRFTCWAPGKLSLQMELWLPIADCRWNIWSLLHYSIVSVAPLCPWVYRCSSAIGLSFLTFWDLSSVLQPGYRFCISLNLYPSYTATVLSQIFLSIRLSL